jgi:ribonuclease R
MARRRPPSPDRATPGLPDRETLLAWIREHGESAKADMAQAFGLKGADRRALREMLRRLEDEGALGRRGRRGFAKAGDLPPVGVADVVDRDTDGELYVRLVKAGEDAPLARLVPDKTERVVSAPGLGDRLLVRFTPAEGGFEARLIKRLGQSAHRVLGVVRKARREVRVEPVDRRSKETLLLPPGDAEGLTDGDLVLAEIVPAPGRQHGFKHGRIMEVVGREDQPRAASLIAVHTHGIIQGFSPEAEAEAEAASAPTLGDRSDLRDLPLITIDPADARDHDDAVHAHPDPDTPGGWIVWVAIADVAAYVRTGSALDRRPATRATAPTSPTVWNPCCPSACLAGCAAWWRARTAPAWRCGWSSAPTVRKTGHRFERGLMRSVAGVSYEQAQSAIDGAPDDKTAPLLEGVLNPLWAAYRTMLKGREARSPLGITSLERKIVLNEEGEVVSITPRTSLEAHRLIEEMMVQANVCAAETLEQRRTPLIYRVHDAPSQEKMAALGDFLGTVGESWTKGAPATTRRFNDLLGRVADGPHAEIVNEVVLRTQMQAHYSPENIGHFGLNLDRYAHFTSPIRRYADLVVHRALIRALKFGPDGLTDQDVVRIQDTAEHITATERRSMAAERDATDRYIAAFLSDREGAEFEGRITGVTRFGLFVRLDETGADGLIPVSSLGDEYFVHDDRAHALVGERTGARWPLGRWVTVRLKEATPITGGLLFEMLSEPEAGDRDAPRPRLGVRRRAEGASRGPRPDPEATDAADPAVFTLAHDFHEDNS